MKIDSYFEMFHHARYTHHNQIQRLFELACLPSLFLVCTTVPLLFLHTSRHPAVSPFFSHPSNLSCVLYYYTGLMIPFIIKSWWKQMDKKGGGGKQGKKLVLHLITNYNAVKLTIFVPPRLCLIIIGSYRLSNKPKNEGSTTKSSNSSLKVTSIYHCVCLYDCHGS